MSSLEDIVDAKIQAAVTRRLNSLTPVIVSIKQEMNGRRLLHSSMTVQKICSECILLFDKIVDDMKVEYGIILDNAFWPTESLGERLILKAKLRLDDVVNRAQFEIRDVTQNLLNSGIHKQLCKDAELARDRALTDLGLFIDGHSKILTSKKIARMFIWLPKLVWNFVKFFVRGNS